MESHDVAFDPRPARVQAAAELLLDPNPKVHLACERQLLEWGDHAREALESLTEVDDVQARVRIRRLLCSIERRAWLQRWNAFALGDVDLEEGMLLLCELPRPMFNREALTSELDEWAAKLAPCIFGLGTRRLVDELRAFFHGELALRGNRRFYNDPENSFLDTVMRKRLGIPISLCTIWLLVGRRLGLPLEGGGLPGHFILRLRAARSLMVDPFHGGRVLTRRDCVDRIQAMGYAFEASLLDPVGDRRMLLRCLGNLAHAHEDRGIREILHDARRSLAARG